MRPAFRADGRGVGCTVMKASRTPIDAADWQVQMNRRLPVEYIAGAEEEWRKRTRRPMTAEELERVLRRYPGDV